MGTSYRYRYRYRYFPKSPYRYRYRYFLNCLIDIDIDIDIFKYDHIDIDIDIDIFQKCRYIDIRYVISIYRTGLLPPQRKHLMWSPVTMRNSWRLRPPGLWTTTMWLQLILKPSPTNHNARPQLRSQRLSMPSL